MQVKKKNSMKLQLYHLEVRRDVSNCKHVHRCAFSNMGVALRAAEGCAERQEESKRDERKKKHLRERMCAIVETAPQDIKKENANSTHTK